MEKFAYLVAGAGDLRSIDACLVQVQQAVRDALNVTSSVQKRLCKAYASNIRIRLLGQSAWKSEPELGGFRFGFGVYGFDFGSRKDVPIADPSNSLLEVPLPRVWIPTHFSEAF